jgi:hypothetical protein
MYLCETHWNLLPVDVRRKVYKHYKIDGNAAVSWQETICEVEEALQKRLFERCLQTHAPNCGCWSRNGIAVKG